MYGRGALDSGVCGGVLPSVDRGTETALSVVTPFAVRARPVVRNTGRAKGQMSRKAKFALDEQRTSDGDGQAEAGGEEDRVLSPTTQERPRGGLTGSESRRGATPRQ